MRAAATNRAPEAAQNTLRHTSEASSIGTGPTSWPGTVWKKAFEQRSAQMVAGRLAANRHSNAATARRERLRREAGARAKALVSALPTAVQRSHVASRMPSAISLPLKTWINSRMSTIWPITAVKPQRASAARTTVDGRAAFSGAAGWFAGFTGTELEGERPGNARSADTRTEWEGSKGVDGAPGEIRTPDLLLRRQSLYPAELRARFIRIPQLAPRLGPHRLIGAAACVIERLSYFH